MRVLFWSELFWPYIGGAEIIASKLILALKERGYKLVVVTRKDSPDLPSKDQYKGIPIYRFPFWTSLTDLNLNKLMAVRRRIANLKQNFAPDVVHINGLGPTNLFFHSETKKTHPAPWLITLHSGTIRRSLALKYLGLADWVVGCSVAALDTARDLIPEIRSRSSVILNGIEQPFLKPYPLPFDVPRLLCIGRLTPEKGFDVAITAFAYLVKRFPCARLIIAGDGPSRRDLERYANKLKISDVVKFVGWVAPNDVSLLIRSSTLVMMPSRSEGLPLVALEASFMARPLVASRIGGLAEVVSHKETGLLVEREDPNALAKAVEYLLNRPKIALKMGKAARRRIQKVFGWEQHVDSYDALYHRLIKDWSGRSSTFR
jgi:glycosyltransferase involved in cell wall biosynthesis